MLSLKGTIVLLLLFFSSLFGSIFMLAPFLPVMLLSTAWYRYITDRVVAVWLTYPVALMEMGLGVQVVITGDGFVPGERSVIIMNHRTRLDWMYLWSCLLRYSYLRMEKICLKSTLKSLPGFGWAMQVAAFIFVRRKWEDDQEHLSVMLDYLCDIKQPLQLLMFPEGTDLTVNTRTRSDEFAASRGLPRYEYVLHPRTTGFSFIVERLRNGCNLDAIHDITVAYPYNIPQTERDLFTGNFPKEIHFHIRRYPAAHLPISLDGLQEWCCLRWHEKEKLLRNFYRGNRTFDSSGHSQLQDESLGQPHVLPQSLSQIRTHSQSQLLVRGQSQRPVQVQGQSQMHFLRRVMGQPLDRTLGWIQKRGQVQDQDQGQGQGQGRDHVPLPPCKSSGRVFLIKFCSILYWTVFVCAMFVVIWSYTLARWYFASVAIFFIAQEKVFGGCEMMEMAVHNRRKPQRSKAKQWASGGGLDRTGQSRGSSL